MNIVDRLMSIDDNAINEKHIEKFESHRLARLLGESEPVIVELKELPYRRVSDIITMAITKKGNYDQKKRVDSEILLVTEAVNNIDLGNHDLQTKFHAASPKDLAEILFQGEIPKMVAVITEMAGYEEEDEEEIEEIKNS